MTMRKGNKERSLGLYTAETFKLLIETYPKVEEGLAAKTGEGTLTRMTVARPKPLKSSTNIQLKTLRWYEWAQSKGYDGTLGDFINEIVDGYFTEKGFVYEPLIVRTEGVELA